MKKTFFLTLLLAMGMTVPMAAQSAAAGKAYDYNQLSEQLYEQYLKADTTLMNDNGFDKYFSAIGKMLGDDPLRRSHFVADYIHEMFFKWPSPHDCKKEVDKAMELCAVDSVRQRMQGDYDKFYAAYSSAFPGRKAPDFTFKDARGKVVRLSDFRGQAVFIDVWGTWCAPCKEEMPHIAKLYERYKNDKRLKIISIACDKKVDVWKNYLQKHPEPWAQYIVTPEGDKVLDSVYHVYGIPRFMLIGKDGTIIDSDASRPSFGESFDKWLADSLDK